ncbi:MAG: hypothetical protein RML93_01150 [Anaerolineales bacterium]|nr:hypothetical protein [Anaerolineales bacterium]MCS7249162.1 hypothetical protein [Anaerolineales bacterium]MDW8162975.1 hypothetical protein [Anaerolineales bacterium]MDW8445878.1 hypothetical protein [Anaerolineales bacterium]
MRTIKATNLTAKCLNYSGRDDTILRICKLRCPLRWWVSLSRRKAALQARQADHLHAPQTKALGWYIVVRRSACPACEQWWLTRLPLGGQC